jgi:small-conductance mechanosensitive channel
MDLQLATARPTGGIIGTAVGAAKGPIANLLKDVKERKQLDYVTESDAFKTLLEAKADALSGTSGKSYAALAIKDEIGKLVPEIANIKKSTSKSENLQEADKQKILTQLQTKQIQLNNLQKTDPNQEALVNAFFTSKPGQKYSTKYYGKFIN